MKFQLLGASSPEESARERAHRAIAREAAAEGIVLLENNGVLPMQPQKIALYGAGSRMTVKGGSGSGDVHERYSVTIEEGLKNAGFAFPTTLWMDRFQEKYEADIAAWRQGLEKQVQKYSPVQTMQMFIFIGEHPIPYPACTPVLADELTDETDTAIYVLSRQAGEGKDRRVEKGDYLLSNVETESLRLLRKHYKKENWTYRRGDIYLANLNPYFGSEQGGTRPVLLLQNNTGNFYCPTLIVAPLTARRGKKPHQPTHYLLFLREGHGRGICRSSGADQNHRQAPRGALYRACQPRTDGRCKRSPSNQPGTLYPGRNGGSVMKSTLPVIPDSYIPLSSHNHEITQARRYGMDAYTAFNMDIRAVDPAALVDIRDVKVNTALPKRERILDFIRQIGNPYCYRHGKYVVRVSFADTDISLEDRLEAYIRTKG